MEQQFGDLLDRLGAALRGKRQVEPEIALPEEQPRPRWNSTTKVVVAIILFVLFAMALFAFRMVLVPLIIGVMIAYILQPVVRRIHQRSTRLSRGVATGAVYLAVLALVIPIGLIGVPGRAGSGHPDWTYFDTGGDRADHLLTKPVDQLRPDFATSVATESVSFVLDAARIFLMIVFTFVIGFYLTRDSELIVQWVYGLTPSSHRSDIEALMIEINGVWSAFFRGQLLLSLIVTVILTALSALLGLPNPLLLGVWGGLLEFLPSIGNMIWGLTAVIIALVNGSTWLPLPNVLFALVVFGAYVAFAQLDMNVLVPNIIGRHVRLHPVVIILGVIVGASVAGVVGVALAAPTIASLRIIMRYIYANLFDLDPFPMVGAPSLSRPEREAEIERLAAATPANPPSEPEPVEVE
jgi:predicted PurR-regulated permease PerM